MVSTLAGRIFRPTVNLWPVYDARKAEWLRKHPEATNKELELAARAIAKALGL